MRILLTGAGGFIGRNTLPHLLGRGWEVCAVSRAAAIEPAPGLDPLRLDLLDPAAVARATAAVRATHLLHLAWAPMPGGWAAAGDDDLAPWIEASLGLVRAFAEAGGRHVVVAGSCAEYRWSDEPCREDVTPLGPRSAYGRSKVELHRRLQALCEGAGLTLAWARIFFIYGPHADPGQLVAGTIRSLLRGEPARLTHGTQRRDFLHAGDFGAALAALLDPAACGAFNVGSGTAVQVREIALSIARLLGRPELLQFGQVPTGPLDDPLVVADPSRLRTATGWRPRYSLESGLAHTIEWWKAPCPVAGVLRFEVPL